MHFGALAAEMATVLILDASVLLFYINLAQQKAIKLNITQSYAGQRAKSKYRIET